MSNTSMQNSNQDFTLNNIANRLPSNLVDPKMVVKTVLNNKWSIITVTFLAFVLSSVVVSKMTRIYESPAVIQVDPKSQNIVSFESLYEYNEDDVYLYTQLQLLKSRHIAERVVRALNLTEHKDFDPRQAKQPIFSINDFVLKYLVSDLDALNAQSTEDFGFGSSFVMWKDRLLLQQFQPKRELTESELFERVVIRFMKRVNVAPRKFTRLVDVSVKMGDPYTSALAANTLIDVFIDSKIEESVSVTTQATAWMNSRLAELKDKLKVSEQRLEAFKKENGLLDINGITSLSASDLSSMNSKLVSARAARAEAETQFIQVRDNKSNGWRALASIPAVLSHPLIQGFIGEEARAKARVQELSKRYGARHPEMQKALIELESTQASLKAQVDQIVASIESKYQLALANERSLNRAVIANKAKVKKISENEFRLNELKREVSANQALYDTFMTRLKETAVASDLDNDALIRMVDRAIPVKEPVRPDKTLLTAMATLLVFILMIVVVITRFLLNNTFRTTKEIEESLELPVYGLLPKAKVKKNSHKALSLYKSLDDDNRAFRESVNTIRTSVTLGSLNHDYRCIVVTSSIPGEGKTTTSVNLAYSLSEIEKVLYIEGDMRRPNVSKRLGLPVGYDGLANVLSGNSNVEEAIQSVDGLDVIVAGTVPPNPLELLMSSNFRELIDGLKEKYDRIIIDSPPIQAVSDVLVMSPTADKVIYVVKSDSTTKETVQKGVGMLLQNNVPVKGVVLNAVDIKKSQKEGYSYDGYYDYHGYSSNKS